MTGKLFARDDSDPDEIVFDKFLNLFIGSLETVPGTIETDKGEFPATFFGEILLYAFIEEESFKVTWLRRFALVGTLNDPEADDRVGTLSLVGPLEAVDVEPGKIENFPLLLHYIALSKLPPQFEGDHASMPQTEVIQGKLTWDQITPTENTTVNLKIDFNTEEFLVQQIGEIKRVAFDVLDLKFIQAGSQVLPVNPHFTLQSNCPAPPVVPDPPLNEVLLSVLKLKFIDFNNTGIPVATKEQIINNLLAGVSGACDVWRNQAALDIQVDSGLVTANPTDINNYSRLADTDLVNIHDLTTYKDLAPIYLEVYMIDQFQPFGRVRGGGYTPHCGIGDLFCILEWTASSNNTLLLAHELGHALGLAHPDLLPPNGSLDQGLFLSSQESIMKPSTPNPVENSLFNCRIFDCSNPPLPANVTHPGPCDYLRPRGDFFIKDFPADLGADSSPVPAGQVFWRDSNIWNRRNANDPGPLAANQAPAHQNPFCSDTANYMHVQLDFNSVVRNETQVDIFIAAPGLSASATRLQTLNSTGGRISFPLPSLPVNERALQWNPFAMAALFPTHSCILAVADHPDKDCIMMSPPACPPGPQMTFGWIFPKVLFSNKIAQKNLNFQGCPQTNPSPLWTWLPWLQFANPKDRPIQARLEIEPIGASNPGRLFLDVDGEIVQEIDPRKGGEFIVHESLGVGDRHILRFRTELPPGTVLGTQFPINVRFFDGNELLIGYQHIIQIVPEEEALVQVADRLVAALLAVAVGCKSESARRIAMSLRKRVVEFQKYPSQGSLSRSLTRQGRVLAEVAILLSEEGHGDCSGVNQYLWQLVGVLIRPDVLNFPIWLEQIRELADRIHEPASRLARQKAGIE